MISSTTPFKIHDENAGVPLSRKKGLNSALKGLGVGGLEVGPTKTPKVPKSTRKALSSISVNVKGQNIDLGAHVEKAPGVLQFPAPATGSKTATKLKGPTAKIDSSSMVCSHIENIEDAYDFTMRNATKVKTIIVPGISDVHGGAIEEAVGIWQESPQDLESCSALSMGNEANEDYTFEIHDEGEW